MISWSLTSEDIGPYNSGEALHASVQVVPGFLVLATLHKPIHEDESLLVEHASYKCKSLVGLFGRRSFFGLASLLCLGAACTFGLKKPRDEVEELSRMRITLDAFCFPLDCLAEM